MPLLDCQQDGKPGYKFGATGTCYTFPPGDDTAKAAAKKQAIKQALAVGGGKAPRDLEAAEPAIVAEALREYDQLETVDLQGVEIMAACGPVHGVGSPPEGDHWTPDQLRAMAAAAAELGDELRPPAKIGHDGSAPRVGWLDNVRVSEDGQKLLADVRDVPKRFAGLVKAGAYRARSAELARVTSQKTGKTYDWAVSGLAWLGAKLPAVKTLADLDNVVALYEQAGLETVRLYEFDNPEPPTGDRLLEAVVEASRGFVGAQDLIRSLVEQVAGKNEGAADTGATMPETPKFTDDQRRQFAEATGLDAAKVTDEMLANAGVAETPPDGGGGGTGDEDQARALQDAQRLAKEADDRSRRLEEDLRLEKRRQFTEQILREGKEEPGRRDKVETIYDKLGPDLAAKHYEDAPVNQALLREYGSDETNVDDATVEEKRQLEAELAETFPGYEPREVAA